MRLNPSGLYTTRFSCRTGDGWIPAGSRVDVDANDIARLLALGAIF